MKTKKLLIYLRYILPAVFVVLTVACAFLPNVVFTLEMNEHAPASLASLLKNAWTSCIEYRNDLLITKDEATSAFTAWTMAGVAVTVILAAASLITSVWISCFSVRTLMIGVDTPEGKRRKKTLCRIFPGKGWALAVNYLILIPCLFPYYLAAVYTDTLGLDTTVTSGLTWAAFIMAALTLLVVFLTRNIERELKSDLFTL